MKTREITHTGKRQFVHIPRLRRTAGNSRLVPKACVTGGRDLVRALGLAGIPCAVVAHPGSFTRYSRFTKAIIDWVDPEKHPEELVAKLVAFGNAEPAAPILYYGSDWDLLLVSRFREALEGAFRFVIPDATLVEDLVDKWRFQALAQRIGLPVPPAMHLVVGDGSPPESIDLRYPLVVKPLTRRHATWKPISRAKALRVGTEEELRELWSHLADHAIGVLIQEVVPGPESLIESYHVYVDEQGEIAAEFTGKKIRTYPQEYGYSTAVEVTDAPDVASLGRELTKRVGLRGVAKFDFKRGADGELYLLEINPRFSLWHHPGAKAGVNIPAIVYSDLAGIARPSAGRARAGIRWCSLRHDLHQARAEGIPFHRWLHWALTCEAKSAVALDDPMPLLFGPLARATAWIKSSVSARRARVRPESS